MNSAACLNVDTPQDFPGPSVRLCFSTMGCDHAVGMAYIGSNGLSDKAGVIFHFTGSSNPDCTYR